MVKICCSAIVLILICWDESFAQLEKDTVTIPRMPFILEKNNDIDLVSDITIANIGEDIFGQQLQFLTDDIEQTLSTPIPLRTASWKDLQAIPTLTDLDIYRIIKNRKNSNASGADIVERSRYFLSKSPRTSSPNGTIRSLVELDPDAYKQAVYQNGTYLGSPLKTTSRITAKNDGILLSMTEAKNPGEPLYFDHLTGCIASTKPILITDDISLSKLVLGDYSLSFGNGLLFSSGYSQLPTSEVNAATVPRASGIKPYISSSSFRYFQGAATELTSGIFSIAGFFSDRKIDATVDSTGITSLSNSAYHRTTSELARKDQAESKVAGAHISVTPLSDDTYLEFGATVYALNYDKPVIAKDSLFKGFSGERHSMISTDMRGAFSFISWSGEFARMISDAGKANAVALSIITAPLKFLELSLNYHNLASNFISPFGGTFGVKSSTAQNETGWYLGSKFIVLPDRLWFFGSANISKSGSAKGDVPYSDIRLGSKFSLPSVPVRFTVQLRSYGKGTAFALTNDTLSKNSFRFDAEGDITKMISCSLRAEFQHSPSNQNGNLLGVGIKYLPMEELSVASGVFFFHTDSYAARFYSNGPSLAGSASFISLYGSRYLYYLQLAYDLSAACTFSARIAETSYPGSGQVRKTSVGAQCDFAF